MTRNVPWRFIGLFGVSFVATACDLTRVSAPPVAQLTTFESPQGAVILRAGALSGLETALSWAGMFSGLLADEFGDTPQEVTASPEDRRIISETNTDYPYAALSQARNAGLTAIGVMKQYAPNPSWQIGELYALVAADEVALSENECSGISLANVINGLPAYGPTLSRSAVVAQALTDLDSASVYATSSDSIQSLVAVIRARALLDSGNTSLAATSVANVPVSFTYQLVFNVNTTSQVNFVGVDVGEEGVYMVSDREGVNGLPFVSGADPRVPIVSVSPNGTAVNAPALMDSADSPMTLASGVEAQLIVAEAALAAGQTSTWANVLNGLRRAAITPSMADLPTDSTVSAGRAMQLAVMFRERAFWLFATGHRHGDLRRLVRQYGLPVESVFPTGLYQGGPQSYGTAVVFVPIGEAQYNPNYSGCINRDP